MPRIHVLDAHIANRIAAGEVVERPASIVKELIENAVDAGASSITVEARGGGIELIRVRDDGAGIPAADVATAFARHATSKIQNAADLEDIATMGFRGEALASIAAVSQVTMRSLAKGEEVGAYIRIEGGEIKENTPTGCPQGTMIEVVNVFFNTPARLKFLKSARTEAALISDYVARMMMAYPGIAFTLIQNERTIYQSTGDGKLESVLFSIYGAEVLPHLRPVAYDDGYIRLTGYAGTEQIARNNRLGQSFFINHRYIKSQKLSFAIQRAYDTRLMHGRFPFVVLDILISGREIDVNVHPNKLDVRFKQEDRVMRAANVAVRTALGTGDVPEILRGDMPMPKAEPVGQAADVRCELQEPRPSAEAIWERAAAAARDMLNAQRPVAQARVQENVRALQPPSLRVPPREEPAVLPHEAEPAPAQKQLAFGEAPYVCVGQLFNCYWVVQQGDEVFFIDQHAAHERRLYEKLMDRGVHADAQMLLVPDVLQLSAPEHAALLANLPLFAEIGFDIEDFGTNSICVRAVPYMIGQPQTSAFLHDALDQLQHKNALDLAELKRDAIVQTACKHAVKAGAALAEEEIAALLAEYAATGVPMTCPHGRPVMVKMRKAEFEKLFKRVI